MRIGVVGAGAWGTALAQVAAAGGPVTLWAREPEVVAGINDGHVNDAFLPGVPLDSAIRAALTELAARRDLPFVAPPGWLCTDNAAMIAWAGAERLAAGLIDRLDAPARPRWPLDPEAPPARGAGVKA